MTDHSIRDNEDDMRGKDVLAFIVAVFSLSLAGCTPTPGPPPPAPIAALPSVKVIHSPVVATSSETVTFTATVVDEGAGSVDVEILVNAALVQTCNGLSTGDTCTFTGGPYTAYEGTTVSYLANATDSGGGTDSKGYYYFAITDASYNWSLNYMPARRVGDHPAKEDLVFHRASDYAAFGAFVDDVEDKMYSVYGAQDVIEEPDNFDVFNFYVYSLVASTASCGTVDPNANLDMTWRDDDVVLHVGNLGDCTNLALNHFTAEGGFTKAFLHESGHGLFECADEYDDNDCSTGYFEPADEPNIWDTEAECRTEQTAKGRDPDACWQFTACQGGWWGIQLLTDNTVMQRGNLGDPWGIEAREKVVWWFGQW